MRRQLVVSILVIAIVAIVLAIVIPIASGIRSSLEAEKTLHAYYLVLDVIGGYIETHSGSWPTSWKQLEQVAPKDQPSVWKWPDEKTEIERRIDVNFSLTSEDVAKMNSDTFTAVTQKGPYYSPNEGQINQLLEAVRSALPVSPPAAKRDGPQ